MKNEVRVAQICLSDAAGGLERSVIDMALNFASRGHHSVCVCPAVSFIETTLLRHPGLVATIPVPAGRRYLDFKTSRLISAGLRREGINRAVLHSLRDIWIVYPALLGLSSVRV